MEAARGYWTPTIGPIPRDNRQRMLRNCPVTREDVMAAEKIYGPNLAGLKGRTTWRSSPPTDDIAITGVPPSILEVHGEVTLSIDLLHVNKIPFLVTISKGIKFCSVSHLSNRNRSTIREALSKVFSAYSSRGFRLVLVKADH